MDSGFRSPLVDCFRRGEVQRDVRLQAAQGDVAPRAHEQVALLLLLSDDAEPDIAETARATIAALPLDPLRAFLARSDVPAQMREFFAARQILPSDTPAPTDRPLLGDQDDDVAEEADDAGKPEEEPEAIREALSSLPIMKRIKLAMKGTRTHRSQLIRDPNKMVSSAVLSSPKLTESEIEAFAKMGNVSEDVLRVIAMNRAWTKNYGVIFALIKNPKTPQALSMQLIQRLNDRDLKSLAKDRNVPEGIRLAAKKFALKALK